jgi:hypothetical protein
LFPSLAFAAFCAAFRGRWTNRFFRNRWITAIGGMCNFDLSDSLRSDLADREIYEIVGKQLPGALYLAVQFAVVGSFSMVVCGIYFILLEKPCMRRHWPQRLWKGAFQGRVRGQIKPSAAFAD